MEHLTLKAKVSEVDQGLGTFKARVSAWEADRAGDLIDEHAFDQSLRDWQKSGKQLPLLYELSSTAIGSLDPATAITDKRGLVIDGEVDRDTAEGRQVWRQIRRGSIGFSIGFLTLRSEDLKSGGKRLELIDLLEISATSVPTHPDTGVVSWKSETATMDMDQRRIYQELRSEWESKRLQAQPEPEPPSSGMNYVVNRPPPPGRVISVCGVRVRWVEAGPSLVVVDE
jgi:HK97 family phage prohead protease